MNGSKQNLVKSSKVSSVLSGLSKGKTS